MSLGKLILAALILGPFGYGLGWLVGYLWFGTPSCFGVISAGAFTLSGALSNTCTSDLPRKHFDEETGPYENYTLGGLRFNRYGDDD